MTEAFHKFPSTPHLVVLGENTVRGDKVLSQLERDDFLRRELVVEEKVDGANLGISFDAAGTLRVQNRGAYLDPPYFGQWKRLSEWLAYRTDLLINLLRDEYILFGEWCYARHSVYYPRLPDWFLGFDVFDKTNEKFLSCPRRDALFRDLGISGVPFIESGCFSIENLKGLLSKSRLGDEPAEGLYLRFDDGDWLQQRAKIVRPEFLQSIEEHWSRSGIKPNRLSQATTHGAHSRAS
ncbi:MAG: RNA ligase family protein [Pseudomonadota bacterium]